SGTVSGSTRDTAQPATLKHSSDNKKVRISRLLQCSARNRAAMIAEPLLRKSTPVVAEQDLHAEVAHVLHLAGAVAADAAARHEQHDERRTQLEAAADVQGRDIRRAP